MLQGVWAELRTVPAMMTALCAMCWGPKTIEHIVVGSKQLQPNYRTSRNCLHSIGVFRETGNFIGRVSETSRKARKGNSAV